MQTSDIINLIQIAEQARENAYAPYSLFTVGAALLASGGNIYKGCNVENAAYTPSNCAERTAVFTAVADGVRDFNAIAIVAGREGAKPDSFTYPCGVCRQVLSEFVDKDKFVVIVATDKGNYKTYKFSELFPCGFGKEDLD